MEIKKAETQNINLIIKIYKDAIINMDNMGINQWDELYPDEDILREDLCKQELYKITDGNLLLGAVVLNKEIDKEYANGHFNDDNFAVIHRLCIDPQYQNQGIGHRVMLIIEEMMKEKNISSIRLDAFSENPYSLKMYEKLGYVKVGIANWRKGMFYLFEKIL